MPDIPKLLDRRYAALLLYCPARSEDIRGIRMKDIDPHKMLIRIERSVTYAKAKTIIGDPKTEAGFRHMLMLPKLWDVLALTPEEMHDPDAYLLHMRDDTHQPLTFQANRRLWERVCAAINVYGKTPHCFRHTFATRAYRAGVSEKTLQSMGGWADLKTMQNVYIHTQEEDLENARRSADPSLTVCGTACDSAKPPKAQSIQGLNGCYFIEDVTKKVPKSQNFGTLT